MKKTMIHNDIDLPYDSYLLMSFLGDGWLFGKEEKK
jgi:hypothetical protein